jgi:hypothetical protein
MGESMSEFGEEPPVESGDALEQLLSHATLRPVPDSHKVSAARDVVHAEWSRVCAGRRSRRQVVNFAIAASVLIVVFSVFGLFRTPGGDLVQVAAIQKSFGTIHWLSEQSELQPTASLAKVHAGQTIVTGDKSGIAVAWTNGGSVRINENTKVEFRDESSIFLHSGEIYFDSRPAELIAGTTASGVNAFTVITDQGSVTHTGTQFMAHVDADSLTVSVREGRVSVDGSNYDSDARRGEQLVFSGSRRPTTLSISTYGGAWDWIGQTSPPIDVDDTPVLVILEWVSREMGFELAFASDKVEQAVRIETVSGRVDAQPDAALEYYMATTAFTWRIAEGVIYVSKGE